ncbi:MAG TPA: methylmalonyl Co-A mutase-associated GTPase MeaB [Planctomycetota bacterium]|nr:methylmalonyl Co-A mutase-associated GTPase MeaB [Planctomycetota bacterium]
MTSTAGAELVARVRAGEELACARLMSLAERGDARFAALHDGFFRDLGRARRLGITGPPGAGKSTLVEALALHWRAQGRTLGIVAVDPTSPFSGGALLGDRVRMGRLALDKGVFIRSMATRGVFGGLARATDDVVDVLDLAGRHTLMIETVGVGQSEVDIARSADLTVVVLHPGGGDTIQAMKAGLMEVADLYLVNKADLPGLDRLVQQLQDILEMRELPPDQRPAILTSCATDGRGVAELAAALDAQLEARARSGLLARRRAENFERRVRRLVDGRLRHEVWEVEALGALLAERVAQGLPQAAYGLSDEILTLYRNRRPPEC